MYQPYPGSDTQLPETPPQPAPASVLNAVKVMYVGAAASLLGIVIDIVTVNATRTAIAKRSPNLSITQVNSTQHVLFGLATLDTIVGLTAPVAVASKLWALVPWLAGLAAVVLLWRRDSSAFFRQTPA